MKFCQLFLRSLTRTALLKTLPQPKFLHKALLSSTMLGYGLWFASTKILTDELQVFELDDNLKDGEVREIQVGPKIEDTILVINYQGEIFATQSKCSHFGFSLAKGILVGDKIICPLHNAGFSIKTGDPDQGPVFDGLKTFKVNRVDGKIRVSVPKEGWEKAPEYKELGADKVNRSEQIVIIGAGPAALSAA